MKHASKNASQICPYASYFSQVVAHWNMEHQLAKDEFSFSRYAQTNTLDFHCARSSHGQVGKNKEQNI